MPPDLVTILNARILTDSGSQLVAITSERGKITRVSRSQYSISSRDQALHTIYDAEGCIALPGLIDCHCHLFGVAMKRQTVDLVGARSIAEMLDLIRRFIAAHKEDQRWIIGRGWDQELFLEKRYPEKRDLDSIETSRPMLMERVCGHIAVLNSRAIDGLPRLSKFDESRYQHSSKSEPIGLVKEEALDYCRRQIPAPKVAELKALLLHVQEEVLRVGLVGVHCVLSDNWRAELGAIRAVDKGRSLLLKLNLLLPISALPMVENLPKNKRSRLFRGNSFATLGFKLFADGSLGARTAALEDPYFDDPGNKGVLYHAPEAIEQYAKRVKRLGMILATHAIGDAAITRVLEAYKAAGVEPTDDFRIEHCSVVNKKITKMVSKLGVILSVQPSFVTSDNWIPRRLGKGDQRKAYPLKTLCRIARVIAGSDSPVETLDPIQGICSAQQNPLHGESLSLFQAVRIYTQNAAKASPLTLKNGKIAEGFDCDLAVLNVKNVKEICHSKVKALFIRGTPLQPLKSIR